VIGSRTQEGLFASWQRKARLAAFLYATGFLATMFLIMSGSIQGGALERPRAHWQDWAIPLAFTFGASALWPLVLVLALAAALGLVRVPIAL
jgi:hypothetical protein